MRSLLCSAMFLLSVAIFVRAILSWFTPRADGPMATIGGAVVAVTDPFIRPARRVLPPIRAGAMAVDLAPLVVLVALMVLRAIIC